MAAETVSTAARKAQLDLLRINLQAFPYPGYPAMHDRLVVQPGLLERTGTGELILPDGPWTVNAHRNRRDTETQPPPEMRQKLLAQGLELDARGRPLHPWLHDMLASTDIGIVTGKGAYYSWGPNHTVDPIVLHAGHILLVERSDTGAWALPGGFIDPNETADQAARREVSEETGLTIPETAQPVQVYNGPVCDVRLTANAWPETTALLYMLSNDEAPGMPVGHDDATAAAWVPLTVLHSSRGEFFGSHDYLIRLVLGRLAMRSAP